MPIVGRPRVPHKAQPLAYNCVNMYVSASSPTATGASCRPLLYRSTVNYGRGVPGKKTFLTLFFSRPGSYRYLSLLTHQLVEAMLLVLAATISSALAAASLRLDRFAQASPFRAEPLPHSRCLGPECHATLHAPEASLSAATSAKLSVTASSTGGQTWRWRGSLCVRANSK